MSLAPVQTLDQSLALLGDLLAEYAIADDPRGIQNRVVVEPTKVILYRPGYSLTFSVETFRGLALRPTVLARIVGEIPQDDFYKLAKVNVATDDLLRGALESAGHKATAHKLTTYESAVMAGFGPIYSAAD